MYINTFQYTAEDVDCKLCTMYAGKRRGCKANGCPWLVERIEAGVVGYEEAIMETFPRIIVCLVVSQRGPGQPCGLRKLFQR